MSESKKLQVARIEYTNGNIQRAYELAGELILESSDDTEIGMGWLYKGLSAGRLSSVSRERLIEACSYFREAEKCKLEHQQLITAAQMLSRIVLNHAFQLKDFYTDAREGKVRSQEEKVNRRSLESGSEYAGRVVGQAVFDGLVSGNRSKKAAVELGKHFQENHSVAIVDTLDYAFELTSGDPEVIQDIVNTIKVLIETYSIAPMTRQKFRDAISPLVQKIWDLYPETSVFYMKDSDELICPNCGYTIVQVEKPERGCLFVGIMSILTMGGYLIYYLMDDNKEVVKSATKGQNLSCVICNHQWVHN